MEINIDINSLICDNFIDIFDDIVNHKVDRVILKGGRSSTKSQFTGIAIVSSCMINRESAICLIQYNNRIEKRLCKLIAKSIKLLGVQKFWHFRKTKLEYVMLEEVNGKMVETDVVICFSGCQSPDDLKSMTEERPFSLVWLEELATFKSLADVKNLIATFVRGEGDHTVIMTYNPPISNNHWCNAEYGAGVGKVLGHASDTLYTEFEFEIEDGLVEKVRQVVHHSTYLDVIKSGHYKWLSSSFIGEAKQMEKSNPKMYKWMYLGDIVGSDAGVFQNIINWDGDDSDLDIEEIFRGLDHGFRDPTAYVEWYYDRRNKCIYALDEFYSPQMGLDDIAYEIKQRNRFNFPVYADSASPTLNAELVNRDINILPAIKGPDSIRAGIKFLQNLQGIYISATRTPNIYREFTGLEYMVDKNEQVLNKLVEGAEHTVDSTRYAFGLEIKYI